MDDYDYFVNKRSDRIYLSKLIEAKIISKNDAGEIKEFVRPLRIISKVFDYKESHQFFKDGKEVSLRITPGGKHEIKAKFYEDTRGVTTLQIQKYTVDTGAPHNTYFTFTGNEIEILYNFLRNIPLLPIKDENSAKIDDRFLQEIIITSEQAKKIFSIKPDLLNEIIENQITKSEIINLGFRKKQLQLFEKLLDDNDFFQKTKQELGVNKREEDVWQNYFEKNTWIFGYGLDYIFNSQLDDKKLEQVVSGSSVFSGGKRVDALLKSQGIINSLCFGEIKTHKTPLLKENKKAYRTESWSISEELAGGVAQIQKTVQKSIESIKTKTQVKNKKGELTGEELFLYHPKSFLIIGSHREFEGEYGTNEEKYSSFELFRKNLYNPEIITFDELYERAKYIVKTSE